MEISKELEQKIYSTLIMLLEDQYGVELEYTLTEVEEKEERDNERFSRRKR